MTAQPKNSRDPSSRTRSGVTLVELLIAVTILGILAGIVVVRYEAGLADHLHAAAQVVASDLAYCRSLAVGNNSRYSIEFDTAAHCYWVEHSGTNPLLDTLPPSPFRQQQEATNRQTTDLSRLPMLTTQVELAAVRKVSGSTDESITRIEFDPLGALSQPEPVVIWLTAGGEKAAQFIAITIDPVTGVAEIGEVRATRPSAPPETGSIVTDS